MKKIVIKNKILARHDYVTLWINEEEYHLKPNSEISVETFGSRITIMFSIWFSKSKKIFIDCENDKEIHLILKFNKYFMIYCLINLMIFFLLALLSLLTYIYPNLKMIKFFFLSHHNTLF